MMKQQHLWIGGQWVETVKYTPLYAPYSGEMLAEVAAGGLEEAEQAIAAAVRAKAVMKRLPAHRRAFILQQVAAALAARKEEAARLIAQEAAKPITAARAEVDRTITTYQFAAEEAKRLSGETVPIEGAPGGDGRFAYTIREPIGVVGAITPFNFPMNLVAHKLGPAFAAGNSVVLKPAPQTPLSAYFIAELFAEAGLPEGALNVITGDGVVLGDKLVTDSRVQAITFTGSVKVGRQIREKAGLKKVTLELGSNSAVIIDEDVSLDTVIPRCVVGAFSNQGQVCISLQRIYVQENIYQEFVERFVQEARKLTPGDPLDPDTDLSVLISEQDTARVLEWIAEAQAEGAQVETGGKVRGQVLEPTVLTGVPHHARISCQEVFAPVVIIQPVQHIRTAVELVNASDYGLQAGMYTNQLSHALYAAEEIQAGAVLINDIPTFRVDQMPYGGIKQSGLGREGVKYAMEDLTEMKMVIFNKNESRL